MTEERSRRLTEQLKVHGECDSSRGLPTCRQNWPDDPASWCLGCLLSGALAALDAAEAKAETLQRERDEANAAYMVVRHEWHVEIERKGHWRERAEAAEARAETLAATLARVQGLVQEFRESADDHDKRLDFLVRHAGVNDDDRAIAFRECADQLASALTPLDTNGKG